MMDRLLNKMRELQVRSKPLYCTASSNCWCAKLETKFPIHIGYDACMTPKYILDNFIDVLSVSDINYLNSIKTKECIW